MVEPRVAYCASDNDCVCAKQHANCCNGEGIAGLPCLGSAVPDHRGQTGSVYREIVSLKHRTDPDLTVYATSWPADMTDGWPKYCVV